MARFLSATLLTIAAIVLLLSASDGPVQQAEAQPTQNNAIVLVAN